MNAGSEKYPRAILHIDGDSFFVGCELTKRPDLRGRPVVTGHERGIATAMSMEAKALGISRAMPVARIMREFPQVTILSSDYESYATYSRRMKDIVRRYTSEVEDYSIDECFADLTGLENPERIATQIKHDLQSELGMTFSVGLSVTKVLAKTVSKHDKPNGLTFVPQDAVEELLRGVPAKHIWGIGPHTAIYLERLNIRTALDLAHKEYDFIAAYCAKPLAEIWQELRGSAVMHIVTKHAVQQSVMKTRTFSPATSDKRVLLTELSRNVEAACARLRELHLYAKEATFYIKGQDFRHYVRRVALPQATCMPEPVIAAISKEFDALYKKDKVYRATGVTLARLTLREAVTPDLFGDFEKSVESSRIYEAIDKLAHKFRRPVVQLASSMKRGADAVHPRRLVRRYLPLPLLGKVS